MADMPNPDLSDFSDITPLGPTADQLTFIRALADWLDLRDHEVMEIAVDLIPQIDVGTRTIDRLTDLRISEASELIEELKSRKTLELQMRRGR